MRGTLGPKGMNVIIDRPIGTPVISRDGFFIAREIELQDPFENMGAQVLREVAMKTNEVVGDGTTTATVLADAMVQAGLAAARCGCQPGRIGCRPGTAVEQVITALRASARQVTTTSELRAVAVIAANDITTGELVVEALMRADPSASSMSNIAPPSKRS